MGVASPKKGGGQVGNTMMTVNVNVAEMNVRDDQDLPKLAKEISQEMARMERQNQERGDSGNNEIRAGRNAFALLN